MSHDEIVQLFNKVYDETEADVDQATAIVVAYIHAELSQ